MRHGAPRAYLWYVVHQPVVVAAAFVVVGWRVVVPAKLVALGVISLAGTLSISALLQRAPPIAALFGGPSPVGYDRRGAAANERWLGEAGHPRNV